MAKAAAAAQSTVPDAVTTRAACEAGTAPWSVGRAYLVRTVTYYILGRLVWVGPQELLLEDAAWVADSGRWSEALATGQLAEVEPYPGNVILGRGSITDAAPWDHALPRSVK